MKKLKNASFCVVSCILLTILIPFFVFLSKDKPPAKEEITLEIYDETLNEVYEMGLEDYVLCVIRKEVPSGYHAEALKAQAVAIRSYALKKAGNNSHNNADLCTSFSCCMAFLSDKEAEEKWGDDFEKINSIYKKAVAETKGQILKYEGEIANTVFFAISSGKTENSKDVWGGEVPYLVSVDSSEDLTAEGFESVLEITEEEFKNKLNVENGLVGEIERSEGGSVRKIKIGGKSFSGSEIRKIFGLRSANFEIERANSIKFKVKGYGHGVGMSQNGANECAKKGMAYEEILYKYYQGTLLVDLF